MRDFSISLWIGILFVLLPIVLSQTNQGSDIVFVVDGSDRVGRADFDKLKAWMKQMVEFWDISPSENRVGFVTYGNGAHMGPTLVQGSSSFQQVVSNINSLHYPGGSADAAAAVKMASGAAMTNANGGRSDRPQIIIHVGGGSDGSSPQALVTEVHTASNMGRRVYTVGVGNGWTGTQMVDSSSSPSSRYALPAKTFGELYSVTDPLLDRVANEVPASAQGLPAATTTCNPQADVVLVVDGSSSVGAANFAKVKEALKQLAVKLPVSAGQVHVAVEQYSGKTSLEFPLNLGQDRLQVLNQIDNIPYLGGGTRTGKAIQYMRESLFSKAMGARDGVPRVGIVITDGTSSDVQDTITQANLARNDGIEMLAVGVGPNVNNQELMGIAGNNANHVYQAAGFDNIADQINNILQGSCDARAFTMAPVTTAGVPVETCFDKIDQCDDYIRAYATVGFCKTYASMAFDSCKRSCGICTTTVPPTVLPCIDQWSNCTQYALASCIDPVYKGFFSDHCRKKCGLCDVNAQTTGFKGQCLYDNKLYAQGAKWYDGCDYECICTDASQGKYECTNKCDMYFDLPADCTLIKKEGECCLQPVCNFKNSVTVTSLTHPTSFNGQNYCLYNGQRYSTNEYFEDGCTKKCTCQDANAGRIQCSDYCSTYDLTALPTNCHMQQAPGACCAEPKCEFPTTSGSFTGQGTVTAGGIGKPYFDPSAQGPCLDLDPQCIYYSKTDCVAEKFNSYMLENCPVSCGRCDEKFAPPTPGPNDKCVFGGHLYNDGDTWEPDCAHQCTCDSAIYGYYRCSSKCVEYQDIPSGCSIQKTAGQCCPQVVCGQGQVIVPSTTNILNQGGGTGVIVTDAHGHPHPILPVFPNGTIDHNNPGVTLPAIKGCLFGGHVLVQGQASLDANCGDICTCVDANSGTMTCVSRCPTYPGMSSQCNMINDLRDACCQIPVCPPGVATPQAVYSQPKPVVSQVVMPSPLSLIPGATPAPTMPATTSSYSTYAPGTAPQSYVPPPMMPANHDSLVHVCGSNPADIFFLLDVSGSLETANFNRQLEFVKNFAKEFNIGPNNVQVGITTFSTLPHQQFWLNSHQTNQSLQTAIGQIQYPFGDTRTDLGLDFVRQNAFTKAHGDRDNAKNILIVVTDGQSTRPDLTKISANAIHQGNMDIFAVGVGDHVEKSELELIASNANQVYTVTNYDSLNTIQQNLQKTSCETNCFFNKTGNMYKDGERWTDGCEQNCLCVNGWTGEYQCSPMCKTFTCPAGYQCSEYPDPDYPCCNLMNVLGVLQTTPRPLPNTDFSPPCEPHSYQPPPTMPPVVGPKPTKDCGTKAADIHFLLDSSGSVGAADFQKQLDFVKNFANSFNVGPNAVQIGATIFSTNPVNQFWLNDHLDKTSVLSAINNIPYPGGNTRTDLGLDFVRQNAFTAAHGDRPGAQNILIVITDGQSNKPDLTKIAATNIHKENLNIFAIGVGAGVQKSELELIASDDKHVYEVNNFDALSKIQQALLQTTCEGSCYYNVTGNNYKEGEAWKDGALNCLCTDGDNGHYVCKHICKVWTCPPGYHCTQYPDPNFPYCNLQQMVLNDVPASCPKNASAPFQAGCTPMSYNPPPTVAAGVTPKPITDCGTTPADIHFLLDASGSVGADNYNKQLDFVKQFANAFTIGPNNVQIGVTTFSTGVTNQFWLNTHGTKADLVNAIGSIPYDAGTTHTDVGLDFIRQNAFTKAHGDRPGASNILVVITDGQSTDNAATIAAANNLHKTNIDVFAIGVGSGANKPELEHIASDPSHVYTVDSFDALSSIQTALKNTACEGSCHYNVTGKNYKTGQSWKNGCQENCICEDGNTGKYHCEPVCKPFTCPASYTCAASPDPLYPCCSVHRMSIPPLAQICDGTRTTTPAPTPPPTEFPPGCEPQSYRPPPTIVQVNNTNQATDCGSAPADIHFLLDASGSVQAANFQKQLDFVKNFANSFNISGSGVRVGVTTFDSTVHQQFWMNDHMTPADLEAAIDKIPYSGHGTRTDLGLDFIRQNAFTAAHGDRDNVNNILVVITDGKSNQPGLTMTSSNLIHHGNLNVLAVGIGSGVDKHELETIASDPANIYTVDSFDALSTIEQSLKKTTCEGSCHFDKTGKNYREGERWKYGCNLNCVCNDGKTGSYSCEDACQPLPRCPVGYHCTAFQDPYNTCYACKVLKMDLPILKPSCPANVTSGFQPGCQPLSYVAPPTMPLGVTHAPKDCGSAPADIHFLLDASGSVGAANFQKQLDFIKNFATTFNISSSSVRIGLTSFDSSVHQQFWMNEHMNQADLLAAIAATPFTGSGTSTNLGLDYVRQNAFTKAHGDRDNVKNLLIIMTDGKSSSFKDTSASAAELHKLNLDVFSIGVGTGVNQQELELMASDASHVYNVDSFDALHTIETNLKQTTCEGSCHDNVTGKNYKNGQSWTEGCNKNCICVDGDTNTIECNDICKPLPPCHDGYNCTTFPDPLASCCSLMRIKLITLPDTCPKPEPPANPYSPGCEPQSFVPLPEMPASTGPQTTGTGCGAARADIQFLLDSSGSVGSPNFQKQLDFIKQFAQQFTIGPSNVQIGVTTFSTQPHNQFWLNTHSDNAALVSAIEKIPYNSGDTHTDLGLNFIQQNAFTAGHGDRQGVNNIVIVMTDGQSTEEDKTKIAVNNIHQENINIFTIGIGTGVNPAELELIASSPNNVFTVDNFDGLHAIQEILQKTACEGQCFFNVTGHKYKEGDRWQHGCNLNCLCTDGQTGHYVCNDVCQPLAPCPQGFQCQQFPDPSYPCCKLQRVVQPTQAALAPPTMPPGVTARPAHECGSAPADIHFLVDASGSVGSTDFQKQLDFIVSFTDSFNISSTGVRVGVTTFSSDTQKQFWMNDHMDGASLKAAIQAITYAQGSTATDLGLKLMREEAFTAAHGDRPGVNNILIVTTDGQSTDSTATAAEAALLHKENINVYAIGIGANVDTKELETIASSSANVYTVSNFDVLKGIQASLKQTTCEGTCYDNKTGTNYKTGQSWKEGCDKNCLCVDGNANHFVCVDVCQKFTCPAGLNCTEIVDPSNACCKLLHIPEAPEPACVPQPPIIDFLPGREPPSFNPLPPFPPLTGIRPPSNATCSAPIDLLFLVDKSASIKPDQWVIEKQFVEEMVSKFHVGPNDVRIALSLFANYANHTKWCFDQYTNTADVVQAVQNLSCPLCLRGKTATGAALQHGREQMLVPSCGVRQGVPKIVVVLTDGHSTENPHSYVTDQAALMQAEPNTQVITIGVGNLGVKGMTELKEIASEDQLVFSAKSFNNLLPILDAVTEKACEVGSTCYFNYTGKTYHQGDRWQYGCEYNCLCAEGRTGKYICTDVCKRFSCPVGYTCTEYPDPDYPCCKLLKVNPLDLAPAPPIEYCTDSLGDKHAEGSTWVPSCADKCVCTDAVTNTISCTNRSDLCP